MKMAKILITEYNSMVIVDDTDSIVWSPKSKVNKRPK